MTWDRQTDSQTTGAVTKTEGSLITSVCQKFWSILSNITLPENNTVKNFQKHSMKQTLSKHGISVF